MGKLVSDRKLVATTVKEMLRIEHTFCAPFEGGVLTVGPPPTRPPPRIPPVSFETLEMKQRKQIRISVLMTTITFKFQDVINGKSESFYSFKIFQVGESKLETSSYFPTKHF